MRPFRSLAAAAVLVLVAAPSYAQTPQPDRPPQAHPDVWFHYQRPDMRLRARLMDRGLGRKLRADTRRMTLNDRRWQRGIGLQQRAMERLHERMNRFQVRPPMLRRRHFRDI